MALPSWAQGYINEEEQTTEKTKKGVAPSWVLGGDFKPTQRRVEDVNWDLVPSFQKAKQELQPKTPVETPKTSFIDSLKNMFTSNNETPSELMPYVPSQEDWQTTKNYLKPIGLPDSKPKTLEQQGYTNPDGLNPFAKFILRGSQAGQNMLFGVNDQQLSTGNKVADFGADLLGNAAAFGANLGGGTNLANGLRTLSQPLEAKIAARVGTNTVAKRLLPVVASNALEDALYGVGSDMVSGKDAKQTAMNIPLNALGGGLTGGLLNYRGAKKGLQADILKQANIDKAKNQSKLMMDLTKTNKAKQAEIAKKQAEEMAKKVEDYYNNIEGMDYSNSLDPAFVKAENALRAKQGLKPLADINTIETPLPNKTVELPRVTLRKEKVVPDVPKTNQTYNYKVGDEVVFKLDNPNRPEQPFNADYGKISKIENGKVYVKHYGESSYNKSGITEKAIPVNEFEKGLANYDSEMQKLYNKQPQFKQLVPTVKANTNQPKQINPKSKYGDGYFKNAQKIVDFVKNQTGKDIKIDDSIKPKKNWAYMEIPNDLPIKSLLNQSGIRLESHIGNKYFVYYEKPPKEVMTQTYIPSSAKLNKPQIKTTEVFKGYDKLEIPQTKKTELVEYPIKPIEQPKNTVMAENIGLNDTKKAIEEAAIAVEKPGMVQPASNAPLSEGAKTKVSQFKTNTMREASILDTKEAQKVIDDIQAIYEVKPNEQTIQRAQDEVYNDVNKVMKRIQGQSGRLSAEDVAASGIITRALRQDAEISGDYTKLNNWLKSFQPQVTELAQSLQAVRTWKQLTPDGMLMRFQQVVDKANRDAKKALGKKAKVIDITPQDTKYVVDEMNKLEAMPDVTDAQKRAKDEQLAKVKKFMADKIPADWVEKVKAIQRINLLLNPKTMARNILGNVFMGAAEDIKDIPGTLIDKAVSLGTGKRTTTLPFVGLGSQVKGMKKGVVETVSDFKKGISTSQAPGQFDLPQGRIFKNPVLNAIDRTTSLGLEMGDRPFYQGAYDKYLTQQMKINKASQPTQEMIDAAKQYAEERTFQNVSELVKGMQYAQKALNKVGSAFGIGTEKLGIGNAVLPFVKTPANILDKALDYSPVGVIRAGKEAFNIPKGQFNQKAFVDKLSRGITGTAMILAGYDLAKEGVIQGKLDKDKDVSSFQRQQGKLPYSFKLKDGYTSFDWSQPMAIPLAIGADIFEGGKNRKEAESILYDAIQSGGQTLFNQSLLQGLQRFMGGYSPVENVANTLAGIPSMGVPFASGLRQTRQLIDPNYRLTDSPSILGQQANSIKNNIPGLQKSLPVRYDTFGKPVQYYQGNNNAFNVLLNPATTTKEVNSNVSNMLMDVYNKTGEKDFFPKVAPNSVTLPKMKNQIRGEQKELTGEEKSLYQKRLGEETLKRYNQIAENNKFKLLNPLDQRKQLNKALDDATEVVKNEFYKKWGVTVDSKGNRIY